MLRKSEAVIQLSAPIKIGSKIGTAEECWEVTIMGPTSKVRSDALALAAMFKISWDKQTEEFRKDPSYMAEIAKKNDAEPEAKQEEKYARDMFEPSVVIGAIERYSDPKIDPIDVIDSAVVRVKRILTSGCASVDGMNMTDAMFDKMHIDDQVNLLGEYVANFLLDRLFA